MSGIEIKQTDETEKSRLDRGNASLGNAQIVERKKEEKILKGMSGLKYYGVSLDESISAFLTGLILHKDPNNLKKIKLEIHREALKHDVDLSSVSTKANKYIEKLMLNGPFYNTSGENVMAEIFQSIVRVSKETIQELKTDDPAEWDKAQRRDDKPLNQKLSNDQILALFNCWSFSANKNQDNTPETARESFLIFFQLLGYKPGSKDAKMAIDEVFIAIYSNLLAKDINLAKCSEDLKKQSMQEMWDNLMVKHAKENDSLTKENDSLTKEKKFKRILAHINDCKEDLPQAPPTHDDPHLADKKQEAPEQPTKEGELDNVLKDIQSNKVEVLPQDLPKYEGHEEHEDIKAPPTYDEHQGKMAYNNENKSEQQKALDIMKGNDAPTYEGNKLADLVKQHVKGLAIPNPEEARDEILIAIFGQAKSKNIDLGDIDKKAPAEDWVKNMIDKVGIFDVNENYTAENRLQAIVNKIDRKGFKFDLKAKLPLVKKSQFGSRGGDKTDTAPLADDFLKQRMEERKKEMEEVPKTNIAIITKLLEGTLQFKTSAPNSGEDKETKKTKKTSPNKQENTVPSVNVGGATDIRSDEKYDNGESEAAQNQDDGSSHNEDEEKKPEVTDIDFKKSNAVSVDYIAKAVDERLQNLGRDISEEGVKNFTAQVIDAINTQVIDKINKNNDPSGITREQCRKIIQEIALPFSQLDEVSVAGDNENKSMSREQYKKATIVSGALAGVVVAGFAVMCALTFALPSLKSLSTPTKAIINTSILLLGVALLIMCVVFAVKADKERNEEVATKVGDVGINSISPTSDQQITT